MPLTPAELVFRAVRKARSGAAPGQTQIYDDNAYLLIKDVMHALALKVCGNSERRPLLMRTYDLTFAIGIASINGSGFDGLLKAGLRWSYLYDPDDIDQLYSYQFRQHLSDLKRKLNPVFGYWAIAEQSKIYTRKRNVGGDGALTELSGTGKLHALYMPDFAASTANVLPAELEDDAVSILAGMLLAGRIARPTNGTT